MYSASTKFQVYIVFLSVGGPAEMERHTHIYEKTSWESLPPARVTCIRVLALEIKA